MNSHPLSRSTQHPSAAQPQTIQTMFGKVARKYDLANSILSMGIHHYWKKQLIKESQVKAGDSVLDCATGTGDLVFRFERKTGLQGKVIGTDFCEPMLERARQKAMSRHSSAQFQWADVMNLPFADASFHAASISFGIRNVQDPGRALSELGRVVKPGGRVLVLEFGQPYSSIIGPLYRFYSEKILPKIGGWISGQRDAYEYLQTSCAAFPCRGEFLSLARSSGCFSELTYRSFFGGIAYLYILRRGSI